MSKRKAGHRGRLLKLTQEELKKRDARRERTERARKIQRKNKKMPDEQ